MKKFFTLMAAAVMALAANATEFTGDMSVTLGDGDPLVTPDTKIIVEEVGNSDGLYNITLKDFSYSVLSLGDLKIENVKGNDDTDGFTWFEETKASLSVNIGMPIQADVTLKEGSVMKGENLYLDLSISALGMNITAVFGDNAFSQPQLFSKEFTDDLTVTVDMQGQGGTMPTQKATIAVNEQEDGKYTLSLKNFELTGVMSVGTIEMKDVEATEEDGTIKLSTNQTVTIQAGDDPDITWALEGVPVDVDMTATMTDDKLIADINIVYDMTGGTMPGYEMYITVAFGYIPSGIDSPITTEENGVKAIYDLSGRKLNEMQKGINIVRKADGTTVKVLKK